MSKFQLHVSGLNLLSKCGIAFERRYINGERTPTSVSAAVGIAVDRSVTEDLGNKIQSGDLLPFEQVADIARDELVRTWEKVEAQPEDTEDGIDFSRDKAIDRAVVMSTFHRSELAPRIQATHVQRAWTLDIRGLPVQLAGTIDVQEGSRSIDDTKTCAKTPAKDLADKSLQLTTYALAVKAHDGAIPDAVRLDYIVMTPKRGDVKLVQLTSRRTVEDFNPFLARVAQASRQIEAGVFTPADPNSWACSKKFCSFWDSCPYAVRPVSVLNQLPKTA